MKKLIITVLFLSFSTLQTAGQSKDVQPTDEFRISGKVKQDLTVKLSDLNNYPQQKIKDIKIISYRDEYKSTFKKLRGIPITEIFKSVEIDAENLRVLSEFYLIFEASDGYKAVFSWNEIFNSELGKNVFIITRKDGESFEKTKERIILLTPLDRQTGRRYIKNLARITIKRI